MIVPMNFQLPIDHYIHIAFEQGELVVMYLFHEIASQMLDLAQTLAKQGEALQALQARLAKESRTSGKPPSSDGLGNVQCTCLLYTSPSPRD